MVRRAEKDPLVLRELLDHLGHRDKKAQEERQ